MHRTLTSCICRRLSCGSFERPQQGSMKEPPGASGGSLESVFYHKYKKIKEIIMINEESIQKFRSVCDNIFTQIRRDVIGQDEVVEGTVIAMIAGGNVLLEGVPGVGKTRLVRNAGRVFDLPFSRIQFTLTRCLPMSRVPTLSSRMRTETPASSSSPVPCSAISCWRTRLTVQRPRRSRHCWRLCRSIP